MIIRTILFLLVTGLSNSLFSQEVKHSVNDAEPVEAEKMIFEDMEDLDFRDAEVSMEEEWFDGVSEESDKNKIFPAALKDHPYIRYQNEINDPALAEAYPWISADGMRLYFIKGNSVYFSHRNSRYEDFGVPEELTLDQNGSITSCWLTNDELSMYTTGSSGSSRHLRAYTRLSTDDAFRFERTLTLDDQVEGFTSALSFTPDGQTALLYNNPDDASRSLVLLDVLGDGRLKFRTRFSVDQGSIGVGQLSKDGKHVYFSVELAKDYKIIYKMLVNDMEMANPKLTKILELKGLRIGKPSLTYDETYMVFNASATDNWNENEIMVVDLNNLSYIAEDTSIFDINRDRPLPAEQTSLKSILTTPISQTLIDQPKPRSEQNPSAADFALRLSKIYPNPTRSAVSVEYHLPVNAEIAQVLVNDMSGREIYRKKLEPGSSLCSINFKELGVSEGSYLIFLHTELGTSTSSRIIYQPGN